MFKNLITQNKLQLHHWFWATLQLMTQRENREKSMERNQCNLVFVSNRWNSCRKAISNRNTLHQRSSNEIYIFIDVEMFEQKLKIVEKKEMRVYTLSVGRMSGSALAFCTIMNLNAVGFVLILIESLPRLLESLFCFNCCCNYNYCGREFSLKNWFHPWKLHSLSVAAPLSFVFVFLAFHFSVTNATNEPN